MKSARLIIYAFLTLSLFVFLIPSISLAGFGISPPAIIEDKLVKGSSFDRTIYLVQGNPTEDTAIEVSVDDTPIKSWISIFPGTSFVIPKGVQQFPMIVTIHVPKDAALGQYKTFIRTRTVPKIEEGQTGAGVSISLGGRIDVDLTVGEGIYYSFKIKNIKLSSIKETESPQAQIRVENLGNVPAGPDTGTFELFNNFQDIRLAYVQGLSFEKVSAFKTEVITSEFPLPVRLSPGEYWGVLRLYDDDKLIREHKEVFNVYQATFFDKYWKVMSAGLGILILLSIFYLLGRRRRGR